jgi:phosphoheptose isomerase
MISRGMIEDTVHIMLDVLEHKGTVTAIVNNRSGGNAPLVAAEIVEQFREARRNRPETTEAG